MALYEEEVKQAAEKMTPGQWADIPHDVLSVEEETKKLQRLSEQKKPPQQQQQHGVQSQPQAHAQPLPKQEKKKPQDEAPKDDKQLTDQIVQLQELVLSYQKKYFELRRRQQMTQVVDVGLKGERERID